MQRMQSKQHKFVAVEAVLMFGFNDNGNISFVQI